MTTLGNDEGNDNKQAKAGELLYNTLAKILQENVLACDYCKKLLTPPVYAVAKVGTVCKSCTDENTHWNDGIPLDKLDAILRSIRFVVCTNKQCEAHILDGNLECHLKQHCKYRPVECISKKCQWIGPLDELVSHFEEKHQVDVIKEEPFTFSMNVSSNVADDAFVVSKLLAVRESYKFFAVLKRERNAKDVFYNMYAVEENDIDNVTVKHCGEENQNFTVDIETAPLNMIDQEMTDALKVDVAILNTISRQSDLKLTVKVPISKAEKRLLEQLKCRKCLDVMTPPIFLCDKSQHGFCAKCCSASRQCPISTCNGTIETESRNHSLEAITSDMLYSCVNRDLGCKVRTLRGHVMADHETKCEHTEYVCPLKQVQYFTCGNGKSNYDGFKRHVEQKHGNVLHANPYRLSLLKNNKLGKHTNVKMFVHCNIFEIDFKFVGIDAKYKRNSYCRVRNLLQQKCQRNDFCCKIGIQDRKMSREMSVSLAITKGTTQAQFATFYHEAFEKNQFFDGETDLDLVVAFEIIYNH